MVKKHWIFLIPLFIFLLLLAKNPFSIRTLIPNLEPYPDTIHYLNPAINLIQGNGLHLIREGRILQTNVPPFYSIILSPIFFIKNDVRMFYFVNILLAIGSFSFFYFVVLKMTRNNLVRFFSLFLYVTNFFIYWYPSLAMAENLTLFLFMLGIYVLTLPVSRKNITLAAMISVAFYITKYASLPLTGIYFLCYLAKIFFSFRTNKKKGEKSSGAFLLLIFVAFAGIGFLAYSYWEWIAKGSTLLATLIISFQTFFSHNGQSAQTVLNSGSWFSLQYVSKYLPEYMRALLGGYHLRFLWDDTPIIPLFVGIPGLLGLLLGIIKKETRLLSISLIVLLLSSVFFMSTFYSIDMRYLYHAVPTLLIGFVIFWNNLFSFKFPKRYKNLILYTCYFLLSALFIFSFATSAIRLKKQIMLNLKYAETPWYYLSVIKLNEYFITLPKKNHKPIVISSLIPYYIDFYSNKTYDLLPLSQEQEFRSNRNKIWGDNDYSDLLSLYKSYLNRGYDIYVHNYGLGNEKKLQNDHDAIHTYFKTTLVSFGCLGACNIWKVDIR